MTVKAFKIHCKSLTVKKREILFNMCNNYAEIYNYLSQFLRSVDYKKYMSNAERNYLYNKYITNQDKIGGIIDKKLPSNYIVICKDQLLSNFKSNGGKFAPIIEKPNIIIFDDASIIKNKDTFYCIIPKAKKYNIPQIVLPLNTGNWEECNEFLDNLISKKCPQVIYNYRDNTISISSKKENEKRKKKAEVETIIGVDRGINNIIVLSALNRKKEVIAVKTFSGKEYNDILRRVRIQQNILKSKNIEINNKVANITETTLRQIAYTASEWIKQFPNPIIVFENLKMQKSKVRRKHGGKSGKNLRKLINRWTYNKIKMMILQKVGQRGIYDISINPRYTSQFCNRCGTKGIRDGIHFGCSKCGLGFGSNPKSVIGQYNADVNGSINIAKKGYFSLYEKDKGKVVVPKRHPNERDGQPTAYWILEGMTNSQSNENQVNTCEKVDIHLHDNSTMPEPNVMVNVVSCTPENNHFSSPYKEENKKSIRIESEQKIDIGEVLLQSKF